MLHIERFGQALVEKLFCGRQFRRVLVDYGLSSSVKLTISIWCVPSWNKERSKSV